MERVSKNLMCSRLPILWNWGRGRAHPLAPSPKAAHQDHQKLLSPALPIGSKRTSVESESWDLTHHDLHINDLHIRRGHQDLQEPDYEMQHRAHCSRRVEGEHFRTKALVHAVSLWSGIWETSLESFRFKCVLKGFLYFSIWLNFLGCPPLCPQSAAGKGGNSYLHAQRLGVFFLHAMMNNSMDI